MNNYRMKKLQNLEKAERQVKKAVRQQLGKPSPVKQKRSIPYIAAACVSLIAALLVFLIADPFENEQSVSGEMGFSVSEFGLNPLEARESYFIVAPLFWDGREEAVIHSVELVNVNESLLQYEEDHIALRAYGADSLKKTGVYARQDVGELSELSEVTIWPQSENRIAFEVVMGDEFKPVQDMELKITYETAGEMSVQYYSWFTLNHLSVKEIDYDQLIQDLNLSSEESAAYSAFRQSKNNSELASLEPISIARLYLLADMEGDEELTYAFYTDEADYIAWGLEEQKDFSPFDQRSIEKTTKLFRELSNGEFVQTSANEGYISFVQEDAEALAGFQLRKNKDGIWQVSFMPMQ